MALTNEELLRRWNLETDFTARTGILDQMIDRGLFPKGEVRVFPEAYETTLEEEGGLYPDVDDPLFLAKLLKKTEFAENKQPRLADLQEKADPCSGNTEFELSPVQRFIGQFLSPKTPYNSALLYHGVGVGKTCSAITVAEAYLDMYPNKQVIIVAPPNIQPGFERTIFNPEQLRMGTSDGQPNIALGCTGNTYLRLTGMEYSREEKQILSRITRLKSKRYQLFGYIQFYNYIQSILDRSINKSIKGERRKQQEYKVLAEKFSGSLIIIDEAHNLRDIAGESKEDNMDAPGGYQEVSESEAGKKLTPLLKTILEAAMGLKLLLLTATPMYNSYREIIFLLNLLLLNDKRATLREDDIFNQNGSFTANGQAILGRVASAYLSFMRGENPLSFPVRLEPTGVTRVTEWPHIAPNGGTVSETERNQLKNLPFVACPFTGTTLTLYNQLNQQTIQTSGLGLQTVDSMIQAGNWIFPVTGNIQERIRAEGFSNTFQEVPPAALKSFKVRESIVGGAQWLREDQLELASPKAAFLLKRLRTTKGVSFVYSRFVKSGALTLAMALEANGYTLAEREKPFLADGNQYAAEGRQCAFCERKEKTHAGADHPFSPAYYVLLTGRDEYTPRNKEAVEKARSDANKDGKLVKVIIGSQVASEGIDLRFIRECFVFDSWYHLNKLEQVIGRAIRMCSHALLDKLDRNCTINLLVTTFPQEMDKETLDLYLYRMGFGKALQVGRVTRVLKQYALDCNLNREAVLIQGLAPIEQRDGQGQIRPSVNINDMPFTSVCDWIETCDYTCGIPVDVNPLGEDDSTYDEYAARWRESKIKERLRRFFSEQPFMRFEDLQNQMSDIPRIALAAILADIVGNRAFRIRIGSQEGYIIYKNGMYLFQPEAIKNTGLPIALRAASYPVKRDSYEPVPVAVPKPLEVKPAAMVPRVTTAAQAATVVPATTVPVNVGISPELDAFWKACLDWVGTIHQGTATEGIPPVLQTALRNRLGSNKKSLNRAKDALEMVSWFYSILRGSDPQRKAYAHIVAEMLWDEFLTNQEQYDIFKHETTGGDASSFMKEVWNEHFVQTGKETAYRMLNPSTGKLDYICKGTPCFPSLIPLFEAPDSDKLAGIKADVNTTAPIYGSVNYKDGIFVFKTNTPVAVGKPPKLGSECANVSNISAHYKLLEDIGKLAAASIGTNLSLTPDVMITGPRAFKNSIRACSLTDLVLRLLDKMKVSEKRWFYRPIATMKTGHIGKLRK